MIVVGIDGQENHVPGSFEMLFRIFSINGCWSLQGPHQVAQKSITTVFAFERCEEKRLASAAGAA